jgi:hypothetical protein
MCTDYVVDFGRAHRGAGDVTTLVRQDACIGDDWYMKAKEIERKKEKFKKIKSKRKKGRKT